ncbi:MAG TPA: hypothetical protein VGL93_17500 [Streptosporangiaceae bacterium]|jgi:uncharacterized membrane protein YczE
MSRVTGFVNHAVRRASGRRLSRRLIQLYVGLALYGFSDALIVIAGLGVDPWDVLHQGLARRTGLGIGTWSIIVGALVLLAWLPLRQRPGLGTVSNVIVVGLGINATIALVPAPHNIVVRCAVLVAGVVLNGAATGCYIGARLGPGPRDGLMTGLAARGHSVRVVRTAIELTVLAAGWLLGGSVGIGTLLYAVAIGPLAHVFIPWLTVRERKPADDPRPTVTAAGRPSAETAPAPATAQE